MNDQKIVPECNNSLTDELEKLRMRERCCASENQAAFIASVRFMQEVASELGLSHKSSPFEILAELRVRLQKKYYPAENIYPGVVGEYED